jgi:hypothetical protein
VVGIEVTELFTQRCNSDPHLRPEGPLLQAREQVCTQIVSKAREIYFDTNNPPVLSHILFSDRIIPADKRKGDQIAKLIADQIQGMSRQDSETAEWRSREDEKEENPLSEWVSFISACRVPERFARWSPNSAGLVFPLAPARLQEEIDQKVPKLNAYKECAEEIWLLIVADRTRSSQKISIMPDFPLDSISSPFAKTFYYDYVHGKVLSFEAGCPTSRF